MSRDYSCAVDVGFLLSEDEVNGLLRAVMKRAPKSAEAMIKSGELEPVCERVCKALECSFEIIGDFQCDHYFVALSPLRSLPRAKELGYEDGRFSDHGALGFADVVGLANEMQALRERLARLGVHKEALVFNAWVIS